MGQSSFERDRYRQGFKELAKLAGPASRPKAASISGIRRTPDVASTENDSGMVDVEALASSDPGAVDRASVTPLASATLFEDEPAPRAVPSSPASRPSARSLAGPGPLSSPSELRPIVAAQPTLRTGFAPTPARRSPVLGISAVVGLAALAAGAFFVVRSARAPEATVAQTQTIAAPSQPVVENTTAQVTRTPAPTPAANPGVDPLSLPKETVATADHHAAAKGAWHGAHTGGQTLVAKADPKETAEAAPVAKADAPVAKEAPAPPPPPPNSALFAQIKVAAASAPPPAAAAPAAPAAAPAAEAAPVPAAAAVGAAATGGAAQRPSQGQVTGALGGVLPAARACLNDDDGVSRAHVVFGSDGSVQSVSVTGFAEGKPAEACIKTALTKAHVPPFAEASYGATVTVRP